MALFLDFDVVDEIGEQHLQEEMRIPAREIARDEVGGDAILAIEADVTKGDLEREYVVEGTFDGKLELICARCLEPFPFAAISRFAVRYEPRRLAGETTVEEEVEFGGDAADVAYYAERRIALRDLASEQVQLSIPMKVVCREECAGLCPRCGVNRNQTRCECGEDEIDERWKGLQQLRDRLNDDNQ